MKNKFCKKNLPVALVILAISAFVFSACERKPSSGLTIKPGVLMVGVEIGYPPMEYYDIDGKTEIGFDIELAKAIAGELGLKVEFVDIDWDGILGGLNANSYDCIISSLTITEERLKNFNFTRPYINNPQALVLLKGSGVSAKSPFELDGIQVAVQGETTSDKFMTGLEKSGTNLVVRRYDKVISCFDELRNNRVDAIVCDTMVANFYNGGSTDGSANLYDIVWQDNIDEYFGICFKKSNSELTKTVDGILAQFFDDGTLQRIFREQIGAGAGALAPAGRGHGIARHTLKDMLGWIPALLRGARITIGLTLVSVLAGLFLSFFLALGKMSKNFFINKLCAGYIFFFRGTPLLMQLFFIYYGLPAISPHLTIQSRFLAAFIAFTLNIAAYCAEIIRAAIQSIDKGQFEASRALGLSYAQTLRLVIMPQSFRRLIPPVGNEFIMVLKDASLVGMIALTDITRITRSISDSTASALVYLPALVLYLIITAVFSFIFHRLEKKYSAYE